MRKLSAPRPATLRTPHGSTPSHDNPPRPARQLSGTSTTTLRPRQRSATDTTTLRDQHGNPPERGNPPRTATWPPQPATPGPASLPGQQRGDDAAPLQDQLSQAAWAYSTSVGPTMGLCAGGPRGGWCGCE